MLTYYPLTHFRTGNTVQLTRSAEHTLVAPSRLIWFQLRSSFLIPTLFAAIEENPIMDNLDCVYQRNPLFLHGHTY